jgi:hypothetical protein
MTAKVKFKRDEQEHRFDFTFQSLTQAPAAPLAAAAARTPARTAPASVAPRTPAAAPGPAARGPAPAPAPAADAAAPDTTPAAPDAALAQLPIPDTMDGILAQLRTRTTHVRELIERGDSTAVWVPAFQVRDLALALEPHLTHLAPSQRDAAGPAIERIVRLAWLLDAQGDTGNRPALTAGYAAFLSEVSALLTAFGQAPP